MSERKRFLLRIDPRLYTVLERWAADDLRSVNAQIEMLLTEQARRAGRWPAREGTGEAEDSSRERGARRPSRRA